MLEEVVVDDRFNYNKNIDYARQILHRSPSLLSDGLLNTRQFTLQIKVPNGKWACPHPIT